MVQLCNRSTGGRRIKALQSLVTPVIERLARGLQLRSPVMKTLIKPSASVLLVAALPACRGGGAFLLGGVAGAAITAAVVSSRAPPPARVEYVPAPQRGYVWQPGYWRCRTTTGHGSR